MKRVIAALAVLGGIAVVNPTDAHAATAKVTITACLNSPGEAKVKVKNNYGSTIKAEITSSTDPGKDVLSGIRKGKTKTGYIEVDGEPNWNETITVKVGRDKKTVNFGYNGC